MMRYAELFGTSVVRESAESDLAQHAEAEAAMYALMDYLRQHNEETPLANCPGFYVDRDHGPDTTCISARRLGLPYGDLTIGFVSKMFVKSGTRGYLQAFKPNGRSEYFLVLVTKEDPSLEVDISWGLDWSVFIHEVTHYLDQVRGYHRHLNRHLAKIKAGTYNASHFPTPQEYLNNDLETNAHFQQGLHSILTKIVNLADISRKTALPPTGAEMFPSFERFDKRYRSYFPKDFWKFLRKNERRSFEKRFYALWKLCHDQWPDIDYIKKRLDQIDAIAAKWAAMDQAE